MKASEIRKHIGYLKTSIENPTVGLPEEVFLFVTSVTPMVNVDLLIRDTEGRILLSWRDDDIEGCGWHVPGGILRLKESFDDRLEKTSLSEIGCRVKWSEKPLEMKPIIKLQEKIRCHFITFVYACTLPDGFNPETDQSQKPGVAGYLKWFLQYPQDMLKVHAFYKKYFRLNEGKL